jgi:hypothetical protein
VIKGLKQIFGPKQEPSLGFTPAEVTYMDQMFGKIAELASPRNVPVVVVYLAMGPDDPSADRLRAIVEARGLHFVDTRPAFEHSRPGEYAIYPLDGHPNAKAHEIYARLIDDYLTRTGIATVSGANPAAVE